MTEPTNDRMHGIVTAAAALVEEIAVLESTLLAEANATRRHAGQRLEAPLAQARSLAGALQQVAGTLRQLAPGCREPWGACPDHGNTLSTSGGITWCTAGCPRTWRGDRVHAPCTELVSCRVTDPDGTARDVCDGHAIDIQRRKARVEVAPLV